jgi:hypothetical protein
MRSFRNKLRRAVLLALPVAACTSGGRPAGTTGGQPGPSSSSGSTSGGSTGVGVNLCDQCAAQGLVCDYFQTHCVSPCQGCECSTAVRPIGPTDGGTLDGGLALDLCRAACPDPGFAVTPPLDLAWIVTGCAPLDGGCPPSADGGDAGPACVQCTVVDCSSTGRAPAGLARPRATDATLGGFFARTAYLEAASVLAFERLEEELARWNAPRSLRAQARLAARDEVRHARAMRAWAARFGRAVPEVELPRFERRSLLAFAEENVREGCVGETWGAAVARWQASQAQHAALRSTLTSIARDEARHAELAWRVARWVDGRLRPSEARRVRATLPLAMQRLGRARSWGISPPLERWAGLPGPSERRRLHRALVAALWSEAALRTRGG